MRCKRCQSQSREGFGSEPRCGFDADGSFTKDNWNCATLNGLRDLVDGEVDYDHGWSTHWSDNSIGVLCTPDDINNADDKPEGGSCPGAFLVLSWYKNRGTTGAAYFMHDSMDPSPLRLAQAEWLLDYIGRGGR